MTKVAPASRGATQKGIASWYGGEFKRTASGERYDPWSLTAAHRKLPFGTRVRVTSLRTQRSVIVRINNRGPYVRGRIIDLSKGAAAKLGMLGSGITKVELEVLPPAPTKPKRAQ
jgi:rare lipoprotein A